MARQELVAMVRQSVDLPSGIALQPGQLLEARELSSLDPAFVAGMVEKGAIDLRQRRVDCAGLLEQRALSERISGAANELAVLRQAIESVASPKSTAPQPSAARHPEDDPSERHAPEKTADETRLQDLAVSLLALAEAHQALREDFDRVVAGLRTAWTRN